MPRKRRIRIRALPFLRAWRDSLGLSRPQVADRLQEIAPDQGITDQAAIAKWESGEVAVKAEDLLLLAQVYGVSADRLFFAPGDTFTPEMLRRAHEIITSRPPEFIDRWLAMAEAAPAPASFKLLKKDAAD